MTTALTTTRRRPAWITEGIAKSKHPDASRRRSIEPPALIVDMMNLFDFDARLVIQSN